MEVAFYCRINNGIVKLYPYPAGDYLYYEEFSRNPNKFEIYDMLGRKIITELSSSGVVDLPSLKKGI